MATGYLDKNLLRFSHGLLDEKQVIQDDCLDGVTTQVKANSSKRPMTGTSGRRKRQGAHKTRNAVSVSTALKFVGAHCIFQEANQQKACQR